MFKKHLKIGTVFSIMEKSSGNSDCSCYIVKKGKYRYEKKPSDAFSHGLGHTDDGCYCGSFDYGNCGTVHRHKHA